MSNPKAPKQPIVEADVPTQTMRQLSEGVHLEGARFADEAISGVEARRITIEGSRLEGVELSTCNLKKATVIDSYITNCLFFGSDLDGSDWRRVVVHKGMYSGMTLSDTALEDITFTGAKLNLVNFRTSRLKRVVFTDCDLTEADLSGAELRDVSFTRCDLSGADFSGCKLVNVDLRGSELGTVKGVMGLAGATIDTAQLMALSQVMAAELGLIIGE